MKGYAQGVALRVRTSGRHFEWLAVVGVLLGCSVTSLLVCSMSNLFLCICQNMMKTCS